jgi:DNA-binding beta-propeller fold protein YncE
MKWLSLRRWRPTVAANLLIGMLAFVALAWPAGAVAALTGEGTTPAQLTAGSSEVHHYEYVFQPGQMYIYDIDDEQKLIRRVSGLPDTDGVRGMMVDPASQTLYISHGGDGPEGSSHGSLLAYDLVSESVLWNREYSFPVDSGAITPDGTTIYMPTGENSSSGLWHVLEASNGEPIGTIQGGPNAHNTIVSLDGEYVFLGSRNSEYLDVASAATNKVTREIGPLEYGVRPFTVNGADTLAFTTATSLLGFQVSSIVTGKVLYTVPVPGFTVPPEYSGPVSHGISLTPNEKQVYVMDGPNDYVHVFDVSGLPSTAPSLLANIKLSPRTGEEDPCPYDCGKSGWLQATRDGRFVFVGDSGDVIDTSTLKIVNTLAPLTETRQMLEIDWADGLPVATTTRYGLGYVTAEDPSGGVEGETGAGEIAEGGGEGKTGEVEGKVTFSLLTSPAPAPPMEQSPTGVGAPPRGGGLPEIAGLKISPSAFRAKDAGRAISGGKAMRAATVRYTDSAAATSTFTVLEREPGVESSGHGCVRPPRTMHERALRCRRYVPVGRFNHRDIPGGNRFGLTGWVGGQRLTAGNYRLRVVPRSGADSGAARSVGFRIIT